MPGCYQSSPTPPDSSPRHLEMSLLGARGMLQGWDPSPGPWMGAGTPSQSCTHFLEARDMSDAHLWLRNATPQGDVGIIPTSLGAELFNRFNYLIYPFPFKCE